MSSAPDQSLDKLLRDIEAAPAASRIEYRERVLAYGVAFIEALTTLALKSPALAASAAAWLEELAKREPSTAAEVRTALRRLAAASPDARYAKDALRRLGEDPDRVPNAMAPGTATAPSANYLEVRAQVHQAAREGRILQYSDLNATHWGLYGRWLGIISEEERASGNPPISAIVVTKATGRPGPGFYQLCHETDYTRPGETDEEVWQRAVDEVHAFWQEQPVGQPS
jgi:hypothetical protein